MKNKLCAIQYDVCPKRRAKYPVVSSAFFKLKQSVHYLVSCQSSEPLVVLAICKCLSTESPFFPPQLNSSKRDYKL